MRPEKSRRDSSVLCITQVFVFHESELSSSKKSDGFFGLLFQEDLFLEARDR